MPDPAPRHGQKSKKSQTLEEICNSIVAPPWVTFEMLVDAAKGRVDSSLLRRVRKGARR